MKKTLYLLLLVIASFSLQAQSCPGCIIDTSCPGNLPGGGICESQLPDATQGVAYDEDVTFYMPLQITQQGYTVDLNQITITGVSGLPLGINMTCDQYANGCNYYPPANPPASTLGCVKFCGTTVAAPGVYNITVYITALVTAPVTVPPQNVTYETQLTVLPGSGGNNSFTFSPASGCGSANVTFQALIDGSPKPTSYDWDLGNGNTSTSKNPPAQSYNSPGEYVISLQTEVLDFTLEKVVLTGINNNWYGDVEEWGSTFNPDPYFRLFDGTGNQVYLSSTYDDTKTATWDTLGIVLSNPPYFIRFWDEDVVSQSDSLGSTWFNPTAAGTFSFNDTTMAAGSITIGTKVNTAFADTDTVTIYAIPATPVIVNAHGSDMVCDADSIILSIPYSTGEYSISWFMNDTVPLSASDSTLKVGSSAKYSAKVVSLNGGCQSALGSKQITIEKLQNPNAYFSQQTNLLYTNNSFGVDSMQWYLNGAAIPGANSGTLTATATGNYQLLYFSDLGCSTSSPVVQVNSLTPTGIADAWRSSSLFMSDPYPNPNDGRFTLEFFSAQPQDVTIRILNVTGQQVWEEAVEGQNGAYRKEMALPDLGAGVYLLELRTANSRLTKKLFITKN